MAKFIQLTTKRIRNLPDGFIEERKFAISLNADHVIMARPSANSDGSVIFVDALCSGLIPEDAVFSIYADYNIDSEKVIARKNNKREDIRTTKSSMIVVEESYEQVRGMLIE